MKSYYPKSWSKQAREMADYQVAAINAGVGSVEFAINFFSNSYRAPIIRYRAAKRFGRLRRAGKINPPKEKVQIWQQILMRDLIGMKF